MRQYEYRVMCQREGGRGATVWSHAATVTQAEKLRDVALGEGTWGEVWIESRPIVEWTRL